MKMSLGVWVVLCAVAASGGCSKRSESGPPVATPAISISHPRAALGSPIDLTYEFAVAADAQLPADGRVFVHFLDADGELMWTDDHDPPVPTSEWKPGQTIKYTRTLFIPIYPYVGEASIDIGLYGVKEQRRLPLGGVDRGQRAYRVATLTLLPQTENVFLIFKDGWHPAEVSPENVAVEWQWTKKDATITFRNPRRDATLYLHLDRQPPVLTEPQVVTVKVGDQPVESFPVNSKNDTIHRIPLTTAQMGGGDMVELKIAVDRTFVPAEVSGGKLNDLRELGVRVFHAFVELK